MGKKGKKTRWRKLPIALGEGHQNDDCDMDESKYDIQSHHHSYQQPPNYHQQHQPQYHRYQHQSHHYAHQNHQQPPSQPVTQSSFNEEEYTKITTPRQDMLFKKGYLGKKRATSNPPQDVTDNQSAGSAESENYACEELAPQYVYPYVDSTGAYYFNSGYEVFDPYTGTVAVIIGPGPAGYGPNGAQPILAAVPCQPVPLQPVEWFSPVAQQSAPAPLCLPSSFVPRKKRHSVDSQNCSGQSSESNCPLGSPQESVENVPDQNGANHSPQYVYPYMFGAPVYNVNGVNVQGLVPPCAPPPADQTKRRKKRRRRKRGGAVTDEGSESSCEDGNSCEANGDIQSGASSDTAVGSSASSKTNSDSGIQTDPAAYSGTNSPQIPDVPPFFPEAASPSLTSTVVAAAEVTSESLPLQSPPVDDDDDDVAQVAAAPSPVGVDEEVVEVESRGESNVECVAPATVSLVSSVPVEDEKTSQPIEVVVEGTEVASELAHDSGDEALRENDETVLASEGLKVEVLEVSQESETFPEADYVSIKETNEDLEDLPDRLADHSLAEESEKSQAIERPITEAVTKWLQSQGPSVLSTPSPLTSDSEDEGIEEGEDPLVEPSTGQKNGLGNPCPASSPSDAGSRVAHIQHEIETDDESSRVRDMCDPKSSVTKYYRLADDRLPISPERSSHVFTSTSPVILKTAVHIGRSGPFPCGVCCMIQ